MNEQQDNTTEVSTTEAFRAATAELQATMASNGALVGEELDQLLPLKHMHGDGCYVRELSAPAGIVAVTKIHKKEHPFFLMKGDVTVVTKEGFQRITAPYYGMTPAGTQRVVYTHTETQWVTVHATELTDLQEIEDEIIAKNFEELDMENIEAARKESD